MTDVTIRVKSVQDDAGRWRFSYRCGWTDDGIAWDPNECDHATPREAVNHVDLLRGERRGGWALETIG